MLELLLAFGHFAVGGDDDEVAGDRRDLAVAFRDDDGAGIAGDLALHAGADERRFRLDQRHALALHVRAHERAIRIVVLEERNQAGRHGDELLERHVHVADPLRFDFEEVALVADRDFRLGELAMAVVRRAGLRDDEVLFLVGGEVIDLVGDLAVGDLAVRRLDEAEFVDARETRHRRDQADVRAFRRLDRDRCGRSGTDARRGLRSPARSRERPPGPSAERRRLCVSSASGLVWSMNCESWLRPKKSRMTAESAFGLISFCGVMPSVFTSNSVMRSLTRRSVRERPVRHWLARSSPTVRTRRLPR